MVWPQWLVSGRVQRCRVWWRGAPGYGVVGTVPDTGGSPWYGSGCQKCLIWAKTTTFGPKPTTLGKTTTFGPKPPLWARNDVKAPLFGQKCRKAPLFGQKCLFSGQKCLFFWPEMPLFGPEMPLFGPEMPRFSHLWARNASF